MQTAEEFIKEVDEILAAAAAKLVEDVKRDSAEALREIDELPDNFYGYMQLMSWQTRIKSDTRKGYLVQMQPVLNLCEARMRWVLKQVNPIQAQRFIGAAKAAKAILLIKHFWQRQLQAEWQVKANFRNSMSYCVIGAPVAVAMALIWMAFGWYTVPEETMRQAMWISTGLFVLSIIGGLLTAAAPPKSKDLLLLEAQNFQYVLKNPGVDEKFKVLVELGAITQSEADRQTVDNLSATWAVFQPFANQFEDLNTRFDTEKEAHAQQLAQKAKIETENERWAAKLEAEEAMRRKYSGIVTV
jgi:hypothetical protein